jgi:hypothetical protein
MEWDDISKRLPGRSSASSLTNSDDSDMSDSSWFGGIVPNDGFRFSSAEAAAIDRIMGAYQAWSGTLATSSPEGLSLLR